MSNGSSISVNHIGSKKEVNEMTKLAVAKGVSLFQHISPIDERETDESFGVTGQDLQTGHADEGRRKGYSSCQGEHRSIPCHSQAGYRSVGYPVAILSCTMSWKSGPCFRSCSFSDRSSERIKDLDTTN